MGIPNCEQIIRDLAAQFPQEWRDAHNPSGGGPHTEAFAKRVAWVLHSTVSPNFGLNGKRGNPNDISDDVVNYIGEGPGHDPLTGRPVTVIDYIAGAGGPNPTVYWGPIDQAGPGAWVKPEPVGGVVAPPPPVTDVWTAAHQSIRDRMGSGVSTLALAQQLEHSFPGEEWGQKRAGVGRSISTDTVARRLADGRLFGVRVTPTVHLWGVLDAAQILEPVVPVNHLGDVVQPPVEPEIVKMLAAIMDVAIEARDYAKRAATQHYEGEASSPIGKLRGTIRPKPQE